MTKLKPFVFVLILNKKQVRVTKLVSFISTFRMFSQALVVGLQAFLVLANFFDKNPIRSASNCSPASMIVSEIYFRFFEDQHSVTIVDNSQNPIANSFGCFTGSGSVFRPVDIYNSLSHLKLNFTNIRNSVSTYTLTEGFALKIPTEELAPTLKFIARYNPRTKVTALLYDLTAQEIKRILSQAYHDYKILGVACINVKAEYLNGQYLTSTIELYMYNPFVKDDSSLAIFKFTPENVNQLLGEFQHFIEARVRNLHGFQLRVSIFDYPMVSKPEFDESGTISHYSFVDGDQITTMAKYMNFTSVYVQPEFAKFGFQFPNGTFVGSLGDMEYDKADIAANPKIIANYNTSNAVFLQPITTDKLMFIIRQRETHKVMMIAIYSEFDLPSLILNYVLLFIVPATYIFISRTEQKLHNPDQKLTSFGRIFVLMLAVGYNNSTKMPKGDSARILISTMLFYVLILTAIFQSTIIKNLNTNKQLGKITTIQELADEGYTVKMPSYLLQVFQQPGLNKVSWMLQQTNQKLSDADSASINLEENVPKNKKIAFLWLDIYASGYLEQFYDKVTGESLFEGVPEPAYEFYIAMMAPKHSPFIETFNEFMMRYIESHIGFHHVSMAMSEIDSFRIRRIKEGIVPRQGRNAITVQDMRSVFQLYGLCASITSAVFIAEVLTSRYNRSLRKARKNFWR